MPADVGRPATFSLISARCARSARPSPADERPSSSSATTPSYTAAHAGDPVARQEPERRAHALLSTPELNIALRRGANRKQRGGTPAGQRQFPGAAEGDHRRRACRNYDDGFGPVRSSNTTPVLVLRFEGHTPRRWHRIEAYHDGWLRAVKPDATFAAAALLTGRALESPDRQSCLRWAMSCAMPACTGHSRRPSEAVIDWVVEPAFAPLVRARGRRAARHRVPDAPLAACRWTARHAPSGAAFRRSCRREQYDAVIDLQGSPSRPSSPSWRAARASGLKPDRGFPATKRRRRLAGGSRHPRRAAHPCDGLTRACWWRRAWLVRPLARPVRLLNPKQRVFRTASLTVAFVHGTSRDDKLWPVEHWPQLGQARHRMAGARLPQGNELEHTRAEMIAAGLQFEGSRRGLASLPLDGVLDSPRAHAGPDRRGQRPQPSPWRWICRMCSSTTFRPPGAPGRRQARQPRPSTPGVAGRAAAQRAGGWPGATWRSWPS